MSDSEKLGLIEDLARSLRSGDNGETPSAVIDRQRQAFQRLQVELGGLPSANDPYAELGTSNEAHDKILYDLEQK